MAPTVVVEVTSEVVSDEAELFPNCSIGISTAFPVNESLPNTVSPVEGVFFVDNSESMNCPKLSSVKTSCLPSKAVCKPPILLTSKVTVDSIVP